MKINSKKITRLLLKNIDGLDPVSVFIEDFTRGHGQITITCYGKAWTVYWPGMDDRTISEFFCDCDEYYIAGKMSDIKREVYDIDQIRHQARVFNVPCDRDDPWNDYDFLSAMYGDDMMEWDSAIPKKPNHEYEYLCKIIKTVQEGLKLAKL